MFLFSNTSAKYLQVVNALFAGLVTNASMVTEISLRNFAILGHLCVRAHSVVGQNHLCSLVPITFGMSY